MNKIFKVIWNEARNAYVVVSEIAKNHGSKSCSTKKLLAMLIATGVMTCAGMAPAMAQLVAVKTNDFQYVALKAAAFAEGEPTIWNRDSWNKDFTSLKDAKTEWNAQRKDGQKPLGDYTYKYDAKNGYWVRAGYVLTVDENGGKYTQLSDNAIRADVAYTGTGVPEGILQSVTSTVARNGVVTHSGDSLQKVTAGSYAGVSNSGGTEVAGSWNYIINDSSWENSGAEYKDGYVDLVDLKGDKMPRGFKTTDSGLNWDEVKQTYTYQGKAVDYRNMYVIDGRLGVFTNYDGSEVYTGTVYGKHNEILMTVKDNGKFYSYWAASVTDPSATMETYPVSKYNSDLAVIDQNIKDLNKDIIKEVTLTKDTNSAIIRLVRNGGNAVDGAITVTSGGGTDGSGAAHDTFVKISNGTTEQTFATSSKVEAIVDNDATTGIKINGEAYTIKSGSVVNVAQTADKKTTTITVDGTETIITDTDTTYTEGDGIEISGVNAISVSKNLTGMQSINGAGGIINLADSAITVNETTFNKDGRIQNVANGTETKDAVNFGQLQETNNKVDNLTTEVGKGWTVATENGTATKVGAGDTVKFIGDDNIVVSNTGKNVVVKLGKDLTGLTSVTTKNAYVTNVDESNNKSVTNVEYVKKQIADVTLTEGKGISITDKKINVKLKDGEENLKVDETGLYLRKDLTGMESITGVGGGKISFATGGNVTINKITFNKDGRIQGVVAGKDDTDAVNVGQLNKVVAAGDTDVHIKAGEYKVDDKNKVAMNLVDKAGNNEGTVTITGVAKAEDVAVVYDANGSLKSTNAKSVGSSAIALGKEATAVANSIAIGDSSIAGYKGTVLGTNAESNREGATLVGYNTNSFGLYSTVVGTNATINTNSKTVYNKIVQGAAATVVGAMNKIDNTNGEGYSGVANNVMGAANTIEGSNGVTIQGSGNTVTDAYKDMDITYADGWAILGGDYSVLAKKESGAIAVVGGANTVSRQTDSTVIGYDNRLIGGEENISHDVFLAGSHNTLTNVSDSIVMGNENAITGVSNVISFGHQNTISANNAVAIGNGAGVSVEGGVALGVGSVASTAAGVLGYGAAEGETGIAWQATNGAVSVGSSVEGKKITRQITNVAAGTADTDAVNVAQLKKVSEAAASASQGWKLKTQNGNASDVKPGATVEFDGDANIQVGNDGNIVSVTLKDALTGITSITGAGEGAGSISFADGGNVKVNDVTIEKGGKITGVAAGEAGTDAVNVSQLNKVSAAAKTEVVKGTNIASVGETTATDGHTVYTVNAKGTSVSVDGNFNLVETTDAATNVTNYGISLKDSVTIGGTHAVTINGTDGTVTGLTNTTWNKDSITSGRAATEDQLQAVATEAGKHTTLSDGKNTTVESTVKDGQTDYKVNVAGDLTDITSVANGDSKINLNKDSIIISNGNKYFAITNSGIGMSYIGADYSAKSIMLGENGTTISGGLNVAGSKITGVAAGEVSSTSTDAINGSQLHAVKTELQTSDKHLVGNPASADSYYKPDANGDISLRVEDQNKNGYDVVIKDVASKAELGDVANRVTNVENKVTQIETDITTIKTDINNINTRVDNVEALAGKHTTLEKNGTNINVEETVVDGQKNYKVNLNKDITLGDENGNNVSISGTNGTITATGDITTANRINAANGGKLADIDVTGNKLSNGNSSITLDGTNVKVNDKVTVDKDGKISGVAKGDISNTSTDAVNGSQLYDTNTHITNVENQVISNSNRINQLGNRVNKVGAGAAALAALHPMDFDPDDKLTFSAGYGNYGGENAAAIGAYYRPDEKVMFSVAGTVGNGENMVNAGVSFALDRTNHVSNSRTALAREVIDLRGQLAVMGAKMAKMEKAFGMLDETKTKLFPDVPANHWAYEYIAKLAGNGYIEGYPDGNFGGDRLMTRYEFAAMLYRAIENGAALEEKIIKEFEPELGRIRVDRISGEDGDRDKIERVRVNDTKGERDHYGNKLAK